MEYLWYLINKLKNMQQLILIILAILAYTFFQIFISRAANKIDANLSSSIYNIIGAALPITIYLVYKLKNSTELIPTTNKGIRACLFTNGLCQLLK